MSWHPDETADAAHTASAKSGRRSLDVRFPFQKYVQNHVEIDEYATGHLYFST